LRLLKGARLSLFLRGDLLARHRLNQRPYWLIRLETFFEGLAIQEVDFHCVSNSLQATVFSRHKRFAPRRCLVLPNEIPAAGFRAKRSVNATFSVGSVGTLHKGKNQSLLLNSIASISSNKIRLLIFGVGPEEPNLRVLAGRLKVADRVHYMGWVEPDEVWDRVDLLLFPSVHEGSPNAVLEAIAHGIPVLASDIPEHREILPAESLLPSDDPHPWTTRQLEILEAPSEQLSRVATAQREHSKDLCFDRDSEICRLIADRQ
ncbi:MAG: glycosyltransferase, partial [Pyrinomonadaceae bacterium]